MGTFNRNTKDYIQGLELYHQTQEERELEALHKEHRMASLSPLQAYKYNHKPPRNTNDPIRVKAKDGRFKLRKRCGYIPLNS